MSDIPVSIKDISANWLSGALQTQVTSVKVDYSHHGTTGRALLRLEYARGRARGRPETLFVKLPPPDPQQRQFVTSTGMGRREVSFYAQLSADVPIRVPQCYYAASDERGEHYLMLLEDLEQSGCTFRNASRHYSMAYVERVMEAFARLHGTYMDSPRLDGDLGWIEPPMEHPMGPKLVQRAFEQYRNKLPPIFSAAAELYLDNSRQIHALWCEGAPTVVHGDVHDGNLFADPSAASGSHPIAGFLDWALVCRTTGMRDVTNFLVGSVRPNDREQHQRSLIQQYRQNLVATGADAPEFGDLWQQYQWHALYTWVAAATTLAMGSDWQPISYIMKTQQRVHRALIDLDTLKSIRSRL